MYDRITFGSEVEYITAVPRKSKRRKILPSWYPIALVLGGNGMGVGELGDCPETKSSRLKKQKHAPAILIGISDERNFQIRKKLTMKVAR